MEWRKEDKVTADKKAILGHLPLGLFVACGGLDWQKWWVSIEEGCGLFGLICTRREIQNSAKTALLGQWLHYRKMIVCLTDQDLINMLLLKEEGNDPNLIIKEKITSFRKGID